MRTREALVNTVATLRDLLDFLGNEEEQRAVWLDPAVVDGWSWVELVATFFDDFEADRLTDDQWREGGLSAAQIAAMRRFASVFEAFVDAHGTELGEAAVLARPDWPTVTEVARDFIRV